MNAYIRFKLALTEDNPTIKPYLEAAWAELDDTEKVPVNISITLLYTLHTRWHAAIRDLTQEQWERTVYHPQHQKDISLWTFLGMYAWHGLHHVAHVTTLKENRNWL
jgi:hypothetical protein